MNAGLAVLLALTCATWFNLALQWYTQVSTYALFPAVAEQTGGDGFVRYHKAYQRCLPASIYVPFGILAVLTITFLFVHPDEVGIFGLLLVLVFNATIPAVSVPFAEPVHHRIDSAGEITAEDAKELLRWNGVRLIALAASSVTVVILIARSIS